MVEKCLSSTRAATKQNALEALLLYIELDVAGPVIEDILPGLGNKVPKNVAATLNALTQIVHNYGCKIVDPKTILKTLPKSFGAADKNVRAEATNLAVELYRWLREAMKPMFWGDLKPTQQTDLESQFEKIKAEPPPKQERLLRSQQEAIASAPDLGGDGGAEEFAEDAEEPAEMDAFDLAEPEDVLKKVPGNFHEALASSKWKERKEAVEGLYAVLNVPRIKDADWTEVNRGLAKCMKDANVAVVTQAAQCIDLLAKGLRNAYGRYRPVVMPPIMERLKEKKASVADALGGALDAVFMSTNLGECLEDISAFLGNKNPQVKEGTMKFLIRCLRTTKDVPAKQEIATICEAGKKLLSDSSPALREGGAEILGTVMKIIGERAMTPHIDGLDDIRKTKVKEYFETAEVKAKDKPKPKPAAAPAPKAPAPGARKVVKKPVAKKPIMPAAAAEEAAPPPSPKPAARAPGPSSRLGMPKPSGLSGLKGPQKKTIVPPGAASPRRPPAGPPIMPDDDEPVAPPQPRTGLTRGLAGRSLAKPSAAPVMPPSDSPTPESGLTAVERAELEELRASNDRLQRQVDDMRQERNKLLSEIQELKNQNAGLIEDHTRDVLSIKAKETQLVRARSDAEATTQTNDRLRRELDRLKRDLSRAEASVGITSPVMQSPVHDDMGSVFRDPSTGSANRQRMSMASTFSEEKENGEHNFPRSKLSPDLRYSGSNASSGRGSPARGFRSAQAYSRDGGSDMDMEARSYREPPSVGQQQPSQGGAESWKRAAEVTSQLKARIEQMKVSTFPTRETRSKLIKVNQAKQGISRP